MRHDRVALQLYTVRQLAARNLRATLEAVAAAGYRAVELAGLHDVGSGELARLLDMTNLRVWWPRTRASNGFACLTGLAT